MPKTTKSKPRAGYIPIGQMPRQARDGLVLCHNHVRHTQDTPAGLGGFRAWWAEEAPEEFVRCDCGWSGLPHYAHADHVRAAKAKKAKPKAPKKG